MQTFGGAFFGNGTHVDVALKVPGTLSDEAAKRMRQSWSDLHGGPFRSHTPALLEEGTSLEHLGTEPEKSQLLEGRKFQVEEMARVLRTPLHKLGDLSNAHLANIEASNLDYLQTGLMPWLEAWEQELNFKLFTRSERLSGLYVEHNMLALLRGDMKSRGEFYKTMRDLGVFSPNDIARRENLSPIGADGDKRLVPLNMTTLANAGNPTPGKSPAPAPAASPEPGLDPAGPPQDEAPAGRSAGDWLDGNQMFSLKRLVNDVAAGELPLGAARAMLLASFPGIELAQVEAILEPPRRLHPQVPASEGLKSAMPETPPREGSTTPVAETRVLIQAKAEVRVRRDEAAGTVTLVGYAAKYDTWSEDLGGFVERLRPGLFSKALAAGADVRFLVNHNRDLLLGRTRSKTLVLTEDDIGLHYECQVSNSSLNDHYVQAVERGDMSGMSFRFYCKKEVWDFSTEPARRDVIEADIDDVCLATYPAYEDSTAAVRSLQSHRRSQPRPTPRRDLAERLLRLAEAE